MSGHAVERQQAAVKRDNFMTALGAQTSPEAKRQGAGRRLSQEDAALALNKRMNSGGSNKLIALSDEANNQSARSETMSNPDLDEYLFNKSGTPTGGFAFKIGGTSSPGPTGNALHMRRQQSPDPNQGSPTNPSL